MGATEETRDRLKNPSINFPQSAEEAAQALVHRVRRALFGSGDSARAALGQTYTTDAGLGYLRTEQQAQWLNEQQAILSAMLEDVLDALDHSARE